MLTSYRSGAEDCAQVQGADPGYRQLQSGPHTHAHTHSQRVPAAPLLTPPSYKETKPMLDLLCFYPHPHKLPHDFNSFSNDLISISVSLKNKKTMDS